MCILVEDLIHIENYFGSAIFIRHLTMINSYIPMMVRQHHYLYSILFFLLPLEISEIVINTGSKLFTLSV